MTQHPTMATLWPVFLRIGLLSFGGPAAQIALMHRVLVDEQKWLTERQFTDALGFCMLLPGPEAMQLATYAGWRLRGVAGGLLAGLLFVIPGAIVIFALAFVYVSFGAVPLVQALFTGIKAAVLIIVIEALLRVARKALKRTAHWGIAGAAFIAIFVAQIPFPLIVLGAAILGMGLSSAPQTDAAPISASLGQTTTTVVIWLALWLIPLALIGPVTGIPLLSEVGSFFARLAVVTFGGAYAVLAYMAQDAVTGQGWLSAGQMMDGLGLAETTPGPLILVTQFVGFLAGHGTGGLGLAVAAALVTLWATFVPCFLWIFAGAPYIAWIGGQPRLQGALSGITAAVVGVILNLSLWFALHVLFAEVSRIGTGPLGLWWPTGGISWEILLLSALSGVLLLRLHLPLGWVLTAAAFGGWALALLP